MSVKIELYLDPNLLVSSDDSNIEYRKTSIIDRMISILFKAKTLPKYTMHVMAKDTDIIYFNSNE